MPEQQAPEDIARIVEDSFPSDPMPEMHDEQVRRRAGEIARSQGLTDRLRESLKPDEPIPPLPYSGYREFRRTGNRQNYQALLGARHRQLMGAAAACFLGLDYFRYLQDLLWAECETTTWMMPAHEHRGESIALRVATHAADFATIITVLKDRLEPEVYERVAGEVRCRVLDAYLDPGNRFSWRDGLEGGSNNWNAVCNGGVGVAAMLLERDPKRLAQTVGLAATALRHFIGGFTDDGGCSEGPSYWRYGFGWYVRFAAALHACTGGRVDLMAGERIGRICRFPLAASIAPGVDLPFADCHSGWQSPATAILINRFQSVPELFGLCRLTDDGQLAVSSLTDLLLYDGRRAQPHAPGDAFLPSLGVAKLRAGATTVGAKAGHNDEMHNHNDVGSFVVHRGGAFFLTDAGAPVYSARTFSPRRYESVFCNSLGHSVPVVAGRPQSEGARYAGTIAVEGLHGDGPKTARIDMTAAYDVASLKRLERTITLAPDGRDMQLADDFAFEEPAAVEEAFMTELPAEAVDNGRAVVIRSERDGSARLTAEGADAGAPGFAVAELAEESRLESRTGAPLRRITFVPGESARRMSLRFALRLG